MGPGPGHQPHKRLRGFLVQSSTAVFQAHMLARLFNQELRTAGVPIISGGWATIQTPIPCPPWPWGGYLLRLLAWQADSSINVQRCPLAQFIAGAWTLTGNLAMAPVAPATHLF
ncbi:hypothetical protein LC612_38370 [Nostoc sp. CHAB 5834]|nr:hypothetical protein [Nostoc sp. CHAB 5834]